VSSFFSSPRLSLSAPAVAPAPASFVSLSPAASVSRGLSGVPVAVGGWVPSASAPAWAAGGFSVQLACGSRPFCWVPRSAPAGAAPALVALLRAAVASGSPVALGVRSGWSASKWFCAARVA